MTRKVSPVPKGFRKLTPVLTVADALNAIDFYTHVFGAEERTRVHGADGMSIAHCELKIGNSLVIVSDENPDFGIYSPTTIGASPVSVHVYLAEVDAVWARAVEAGATVLVPLADTYWGERYGKFIDPYGHVWSMAKRIERLSADEIAARAAALSAPVEAFDANINILDETVEPTAIAVADELVEAA